jgi:hypothetical protein
MARHRSSRIAERLRRGLGLRRRAMPAPADALPAPPAEQAPATRVPAPAAALRNVGEPPAAGASRDQAGEAELDTLRGELVRELDRLAEGDHGSASFRRIAS